jgi:hypothetical protein
MKDLDIGKATFSKGKIIVYVTFALLCILINARDLLRRITIREIIAMIIVL